jgi:integrase
MRHRPPVRNAVGVYRRFVSWCDQVGIACGDFVAGYKPPRLRPPEEPEALTAEQARQFLDAARDHYLEVPVMLALFAGLSRGDLRALNWREIDLTAGLITRPRHKTGCGRLPRRSRLLSCARRPDPDKLTLIHDLDLVTR